MSPSPAQPPTSPPTGKIHIKRRAPELSATVNQLRICTTGSFPPDYSTRVLRATTSASRQRFSFDNGRDSTIRTVSPGLASPCSSWA